MPDVIRWAVASSDGEVQHELQQVAAGLWRQCREARPQLL